MQLITSKTQSISDKATKAKTREGDTYRSTRHTHSDCAFIAIVIGARVLNALITVLTVTASDERTGTVKSERVTGFTKLKSL